MKKENKKQKALEEEIKCLFRGYRKMTGKLQKQLLELGIQIEHKKKHYVLKLDGASQIFICPCSASDSRSGLNLANELIRAIR